MNAARGEVNWDRFDIITWPGHLTISSGHGTWTFARTEDMLQFFRNGSGLTRINPGYWGEKVQGGLLSGNRATEEYDSDLFRASVREHVNEFVEDCGWTDQEIAELREAVEDEVTGDHNDWTHDAGARELLDQFRYRTMARRFRFEDSWEWSLSVPSAHFLWSLWAIVHGIAKYDERNLRDDIQKGGD